jgi:hypothetical protein
MRSTLSLSVSQQSLSGSADAAAAMGENSHGTATLR